MRQYSNFLCIKNQPLHETAWPPSAEGLCARAIRKALAYFMVNSSRFTNVKRWLMTCIHCQEYQQSGLVCLKKCSPSQVWWRKPLIPALRGRGRRISEFRGQPGLQSEFQYSQGYTEKPCLRKKKKVFQLSCHVNFLELYVVYKTFACIYIGVPYSPTEARRGYQIPRD